MKLDRATLCLPIADRAVSHTFYTALGFVAVGEPGDDGLPEPLQLEGSTIAGCRTANIGSRSSLSARPASPSWPFCRPDRT